MPRPSPDPVSDRPRLGVAMIGHSFMGAVHSQAWRTAPRVFDLPFDVDMTVVCGRDPKSAARVAVDDATAFTGRLEGGALVVVEATRFATGRKNVLRIEVNGSRGSVVFDFESMNELLLYDADDPETEAGFRRILVTEPGHPYLGAWWPPGHGLGYEHAFVHQVHDFLIAVSEHGSDPRPSVADGLQVQYVLQAIERSAADSSRRTSIG